MDTGQSDQILSYWREEHLTEGPSLLPTKFYCRDEVDGISSGGKRGGKAEDLMLSIWSYPLLARRGSGTFRKTPRFSSLLHVIG